MKKILFFTILILPISLFSQWEFQYFVIKAGLVNHAFSPQPSIDNNLFLNTLEGEMKLYPDSSFFPDYVPGVEAGLDFHIDFTNDMGGFIVGLHYLNFGYSNRYSTENQKYTLLQTYRVHALSIPIYVKFGREIFDQQRYFTLGLKYNFNFAAQIIEKVNWLDAKAIYWTNKAMFDKNNYQFFVGFNYLIFNIELNFLPHNFLNSFYAKEVGTPNKSIIIYPFKSQPEKLFYLSTSITIPLSPWTTTKSYFFKKLFRIFR